MRRFFREVYMDSVFPILNSTELPPYVWGNDEREKVKLLSCRFRNLIFCDGVQLQFLQHGGTYGIATLTKRDASSLLVITSN